MNINTTVTYLFSEVVNYFRTDFEKSLNEINLHSGQVFILQMLYSDDGQSQIDLALKLNVSPPTINNMVKSLTKNSFVKCRKCNNDGRMMRVYLTEKALQIRPLLDEKWLEFETEFFSSLTATEKLVLFQLLEKLKTNNRKSNANLTS